MDNGVDHYIVDRSTGQLCHAETGDSVGLRWFQHPRDGDQYHLATILQDWAKEKYTPNVLIKNIGTGADR